MMGAIAETITVIKESQSLFTRSTEIICIKAGLLALPVFYSPSHPLTSGQWHVEQKFLLLAEPESQLREQPPILTGFPFNPDINRGPQYGCKHN
jgi:hypothetical protein